MAYPAHPPTEATRQVVTDQPAPLARLGQILILVAGAALTLSGAITLIRTGIHQDLATPVVTVLGHTHTPWLGIGELVAGILLLVGGASPLNRELGLVVGVILIVLGVMLLADPAGAPRQLAIDHGYGWIPLLAGIAATVGGLLPGGWMRRSHWVDHRPTAV